MTDSEKYPETLPADITPFEDDAFTFRTSAGKEALRDIQAEISKVESQLERYTKHEDLIINGIPILQHLVSLTHDEKQLRILGKALVRVSKIMPHLDELEKRKAVIEMATENPKWLIATFAELPDNQISEGIEALLDEHSEE